MTGAQALHALHVPPFVPPRALASGHLQTLLVPMLPAPRGARGERVRVPIEGGGALTGRLLRAPGGRARACVLVLHGITGTADEGYVARTARLATARGLDALRLNLRGAGESASPGVAPLYHSGLTADVRDAVAFLGRRYDRVHLVGFSLGGQIALRTVGEWGDDARPLVASVAAISAPLELSRCAAFAERPAAAPYRAFIVRGLKARYAAARAHMGPRFARDLLRDVRTIREYDAAVVAPFFGFRDVEDYYARASAAAVLSSIAVPTLVMHAMDDPLVPPLTPEHAADLTRANENLRSVVTARGGHVGFLAAAPAPGDATRFWAEQRAIDLASAIEG